MTDRDSSRPLLPRQGQPLLTCPGCQRPLSASDLANLGLPIPQPGVTVEEYCDAELLDPDELHHIQCLQRDVELA